MFDNVLCLRLVASLYCIWTLIYKVAVRRFKLRCRYPLQVYNIRAVAVYGGGGKYEMSRALKEQSPEMVIATPGRFIEMVRTVVVFIRVDL
jgi:superfamily II DNA/RNA helicase